VEIDVAIDADVGVIAADAERLQQIVWNVLSNAIKFTPSGGHVEVRAMRAEDRVILRVRDDGIGVHPEFLPHLFEAFRQADGSTTRRHGGLGLGLAIVRHLVQAHGGTITPFSEGPGKGATFTIELPAAPLPKEARRAVRRRRRDAPDLASRAKVSLEGVRVLVVDDDDDSRQLIGLVLAERGASVTTVPSADDAFTQIDSAAPDVLVSDIGMPRVDGYALIRQLRADPLRRGSATPAIALTAYARPEDGARAIDAGFEAHLTKPIDAERLAEVVASLAGGKRAPSSARVRVRGAMR
jgi:CheY-like chemotaxis protein